MPFLVVTVLLQQPLPAAGLLCLSSLPQDRQTRESNPRGEWGLC